MVMIKMHHKIGREAGMKRVLPVNKDLRWYDVPLTYFAYFYESKVTQHPVTPVIYTLSSRRGRREQGAETSSTQTVTSMLMMYQGIQEMYQV